MVAWRKNVYTLKSIHHYPCIWHVNYLVFSGKKIHDKKFGLNIPILTKNCHISLKIIDLWNNCLVISSPKYVLTYAKKQQFYLACLENTSPQSFFIFDQKRYLLPQNDGIVIFFICTLFSINDLTCKVWLEDIPLSMI